MRSPFPMFFFSFARVVRGIGKPLADFPLSFSLSLRSPPPPRSFTFEPSSLVSRVDAGRQLFEKDLQGSLVTSDADAAYDEEGAVSVDASQYERVDHLIEEEEEERRLGALSDDD